MFTEQEKLEITIDGLRNGDIFMNEDGIPAVSYTHLTLPTILLV